MSKRDIDFFSLNPGEIGSVCRCWFGQQIRTEESGQSLLMQQFLIFFFSNYSTCPGKNLNFSGNQLWKYVSCTVYRLVHWVGSLFRENYICRCLVSLISKQSQTEWGFWLPRTNLSSLWFHDFWRSDLSNVASLLHLKQLSWGKSPESTWIDANVLPSPPGRSRLWSRNFAMTLWRSSSICLLKLYLHGAPSAARCQLRASYSNRVTQLGGSPSEDKSKEDWTMKGD